MAAVNITVDDGVRAVEIESRTDGHLYCTYCDVIWCKHVKNTIVNGYDADLIWHYLEDTDRLTVMVPLSTETDLWIPVEITEPASSGRDVLLHVPPHAKDEAIIGVLFPGEGRNVIRQLIYNWFLPQLFDPVTGIPRTLACTATSHKPKQHVIMKKRLNDPKTKTGEQWLLRFTGMCHECSQMLSAVNDLVPDRRF